MLSPSLPDLGPALTGGAFFVLAMPHLNGHYPIMAKPWYESAWVAPAVVLAGLGVASVYIESRFSSVDRRFDGLASDISRQQDRSDRILEKVNDINESLASIRAELMISNDRLSRISARLQVTEIPSNPSIAGDPDRDLELRMQTGHDPRPNGGPGSDSLIVIPPDLLVPNRE